MDSRPCGDAGADSAIRILLADAQYYWAEFFSFLWKHGVTSVIPAPLQVRQRLVHLWTIERGFILKGD